VPLLVHGEEEGLVELVQALVAHVVALDLEDLLLQPCFISRRFLGIPRRARRSFSPAAYGSPFSMARSASPIISLTRRVWRRKRSATAAL
jgi:hypothetical protein